MRAVSPIEDFEQFRHAMLRMITLDSAIDTALERDHLYVANLRSKRDEQASLVMEAWSALIIQGVDEEFAELLRVTYGGRR